MAGNSKRPASDIGEACVCPAELAHFQCLAGASKAPSEFRSSNLMFLKRELNLILDAFLMWISYCVTVLLFCAGPTGKQEKDRSGYVST